MKQLKQKKNNSVPGKPVNDKHANEPENYTLQKLDWKWALVAFIIACLLYANTLFHAYVLDDAIAISTNCLNL